MTRIIAEIGINHQGSVETALQLCSMAKDAGADYVKFQKRTPELCVPKSEWGKPKTTPWGTTGTYIEYKKAIEFGVDDYEIINTHCENIGIGWFVSVWDILSLDLMVSHFPDMPYIKIPSAMFMHRELQQRAMELGFDLIVSTGMSTGEEIIEQASWLNQKSRELRRDCVLMACHSAYPSPEEEINLHTMYTLGFYSTYVGFSSHSPSPFVPILALAYGEPDLIEVHITLDRTMIGSDHGASLEKKGLRLIARERDRFAKIRGDGVFRLYDSEVPAREKMAFNNET